MAKDFDDETPAKPDKPINIGEVYSKDSPEFDPEWSRTIDILEGMKEKMESVKHLSEEKQKAFWVSETEKAIREYPSNPLGPCKHKDLTAAKITEAFGYMTDLGYGDIQELCDLTVFHEALGRMDIDECEEILAPADIKMPPKTFMNRCLLITMENVVRERLVSDGQDSEQAQDTFIYFGMEPKDKRSMREYTFSPFSYDWRGPLAEKAEKSFKEEE